jgi:hypothetical protein
VHPGVQQRQQGLDRLDARARIPFREHVGAQRRHGAHRAYRQRFADARRVAAQQVHLQLGE